MYCHNCGYKLDNSAIYCERCGVKVKKEEAIKSYSEKLSDSEALSRYYDLEYDLEEMKEKLSKLPSEEALLTRLNSSMDQKLQQLRQVQNIMEKEKKDYQELLKFSFAKIKAKLSGDIDEKKRKENAEYLRALANYEHVQEEYKELQDNVEDLKAQITQLKNLESKIPETEKKIDELLEQLTVGKTTYRLDELKTEYNNIQEKLNKAKEIGEKFRQADNLVGEAENYLESATKRLRSADSLGTWDTFLGGGIFVDGMKHGRLESARQDINQAQTLLGRAKDYVDVIDDIYIDFEAPGFFTDVVFDNFFFDLYGNAKISRTRQRAEEALYQISQNRNKLSQYVIEWEQKRKNLISQINGLRKEMRAERESLL